MSLLADHGSVLSVFRRGVSGICGGLFILSYSEWRGLVADSVEAA